MAKLTLVRGDDWEGFYLDGKLASEGHSHETMETIQFVIKRGVTEAETKWADNSWLHDQGSLPDNLSDVQLENETQ